MIAAVSNVRRRPSAGISAKPAIRAPAIAPIVFAV